MKLIFLCNYQLAYCISYVFYVKEIHNQIETADLIIDNVNLIEIHSRDFYLDNFSLVTVSI